MDGGSSTIEGGALIGKGSFGCVFKPALKCPGDKVINDNIVSKVFYSQDSSKESLNEIKINDMINKIKNHENWSHIWFKKCKPPTYNDIYEQDKEIDDCLYEDAVWPSDFDKYRQMLQGNYAGESFAVNMKKDFKSSIIANNSKFTTMFLKYMKLMKPLFVGLKEMYDNSITHNDIKEDNIMIDDDGCKYIDFGLACKFNDKKTYKNRSKREFLHERIYLPYPYEYIFLHVSPDLLKEEYKEIKNKIYRANHHIYTTIHGNIFSRKVNEYLIQLIERLMKGSNSIRSSKEINSLIDTYSLGMLIPFFLYKRCKVKRLKQIIKLDKIKSFIDLFKHMTEPDYNNRMKPGDIYSKYLELDKLYLSNNIAKTKGTKRTKRKKRK
tara:strand:+ start:3105 stop:4247 length:1143 start_codon:yes stop_codon:yes gene_type:complete